MTSLNFSKSFHNKYFPSNIVDTITKKNFKQKHTIQQPPPQLPSRPYTFLFLSWLYIRQNKDEITNLTQKRFPHFNFKIVFRNTFSIGSIFKHKERLSKPLCCDIINKYVCPISKRSVNWKHDSAIPV